MKCLLSPAAKKFLKTRTMIVTITTTFKPAEAGASSIRSRNFNLRQRR